MSKKLPQITESASKLKTELRKASTGFQKQRLTALYLIRTNQATTRTQVADLIGVNRKTIGHWLATYEAEGLNALLVRRYATGRPPLLCCEQQAILRAALSSPEGFSSYGQIQSFIASTFDVQMSYKAVYSMVHDKWGAKLKVPRKSHKKKDDAAGEAFVSNFCSTVESTISKHSASFDKVRLFCQDESRFGILPVCHRRVTLPGIKPIAQIAYSYESVYLYGAVEPRTGKSVFLPLPGLNSAGFQRFVDALSDTFSETLNVVVVDNGSFHRARSLNIPDNVELIFLPPYSPELNPIERLWQDVKSKLFYKAYDTLEEMQSNLTSILGAYSEGAIAKITGFSYFVKTANAI